jgi:hypothetical protein
MGAHADRPRPSRGLNDPIPIAGTPILTSQQRVLLNRYVAATDDLRASTILDPATRITYSASRTPAGTVVSREHPSREIIRGFAVVFRQFFANEEPASFQNTLGTAI